MANNNMSTDCIFSLYFLYRCGTVLNIFCRSVMIKIMYTCTYNELSFEHTLSFQEVIILYNLISDEIEMCLTIN